MPPPADDFASLVEPVASRYTSAPVRQVRCPTCRRETPWEGNPSGPSAPSAAGSLDLAAWADERYRIPGEPVPAEPDDAGRADERG